MKSKSTSVQALARTEMKFSGKLTDEWLLANTSVKQKRGCVSKTGKKFLGKIQQDGVQFYLGSYSTEAEAAEVVRQAKKTINAGGKLDENWKSQHCTLRRHIKV